MEFVKVCHADGRAADITPAEVAYYRTMGFDPVDGKAPAVAASDAQGGTPSDPIIEEIKGLRSDLASIFSPAEQIEPVEGAVMLQSEPDPRLDLILDESGGLRSDLATFWAADDADPAEPVDGERIELREPATPDDGEPTGAEDPSEDPHTVDPDLMTLNEPAPGAKRRK